jgi:hypothetical protein
LQRSASEYTGSRRQPRGFVRRTSAESRRHEKSDAGSTLGLGRNQCGFASHGESSVAAVSTNGEIARKLYRDGRQ